MVRSEVDGEAISCLLCFVWICKGDLNKRHNGKGNPMQSYLFCIKACFQVRGEAILFSLELKEYRAWFVQRSTLYFALRRGLKFNMGLLWEVERVQQSVKGLLCVFVLPSTVYCLCSMKNDVLWKVKIKNILFSDHVVPITASGPQG